MSIPYIKNRVIEISPSSLSIWNEVILLVYGVVKVKLPVAGAAKFEMCVVIRFLNTEGQLADLESHFSVFFPLKSVSEVSQGLKMQFSPIHTQRGRGAFHFEFSETSWIEFQ